MDPLEAAAADPSEPHPNDGAVCNDDIPQLSSHAIEALKEFFADQNRALAEEQPEGVVELVAEDWRLSQFWYDRDTAETVTKEVLTLCETLETPSVACISCPTVFAYLKKSDPNVQAQLLEYDQRFSSYGTEFTFYDYNKPEGLPSSLKHSYSLIIADPPYLSRDCLEKISETISFLLRPGQSYLLLLTGEVQKDRAAQLLSLRPCRFRPQHSSKLGNDFRLFTNYDPGVRLGGWEDE
ncbi:unnamed protein product [Cuscuta campestris]|uniref:Protein-lysine N-methyltransferase CCAM_LOCUS11444 n=1 Tax=Cuscuta campestris TaxID=132261 RepID=A0A484KXY6_9ASTE|nr:unnamed protein product [Cuscuta campestris]